MHDSDCAFIAMTPLQNFAHFSSQNKPYFQMSKKRHYSADPVDPVFAHFCYIGLEKGEIIMGKTGI